MLAYISIKNIAWQHFQLLWDASLASRWSGKLNELKHYFFASLHIDLIFNRPDSVFILICVQWSKYNLSRTKKWLSFSLSCPSAAIYVQWIVVDFHDSFV